MSEQSLDRAFVLRALHLRKPDVKAWPSLGPVTGTFRQSSLLSAMGRTVTTSSINASGILRLASALITALFVFATSEGVTTPASAGAPSAADLQARLSTLTAGTEAAAAGQKLAAAAFIPKLYEALGFRLAWTNPETVKALNAEISRSWEDGLTPADFHAAFVKAEAEGSTPGLNPLERDFVLSDALIRLLHQLYFGKVDPVQIDAKWNFAKPVLSQDPAPLIAEALQRGDIRGLVERAQLKHPLYTKLRALLQQYTHFSSIGGWPQVPTGPALKPGDRDPRVANVRERLRFTGEYQATAEGEPELYDPQLAAAVELFQTEHGLEPDGVLGANTAAELNISAESRVDQIRVNLERARWLLRTLEPDMVIVNVAGFYLHLFFNGDRVWSSRVIVGKSYTKTPIFADTMKTVVFNPDWTVPASIVRGEIFPKAAADPGYLSANNYYLKDRSGQNAGTEVDFTPWTAATFPYGIVQRPGPRNALGAVKFLFPNKYNVYLHDTPGRAMFAKSGRSFSHGCIRVKDPLKLAALILGNRLGWDRAKVDAAVASGKTQTVALPKPLPVLILYWTVDPSPSGGAVFHKDIYGRDARVLKALNAEYKLP